MDGRQCNKWTYRVLTMIVFLLSFLGLGPLKIKTQDKCDNEFRSPGGLNCGTAAANIPDPTSDYALMSAETTSDAGPPIIYANMIGAGCRGKSKVIGDADYPNSKIGCKKSQELKNNLYARIWLGTPNCKDPDKKPDDPLNLPCLPATLITPGHPSPNGYKEKCALHQAFQEGLGALGNWDKKDVDSAYPEEWENGMRRLCERLLAQFAASALWATSVALLGVAFIVTIVSCLVLRCNCFKGCANKLLRLITALALFAGAIFCAAAIGLSLAKGGNPDNECGAMRVEQGTSRDKTLPKIEVKDPCYKKTPGLWAYIILVVALGWVAAFSALGAACCCDPDKKDDDGDDGPPGHAAAPTSDEIDVA